MKTLILTAAAAALSLAACNHERAAVERRAEVINDDAHAASKKAVASGHNVDDGMKSKTGIVGDLDLGTSINAKGDIADRTQQFNVGNSICASIDADHLKAGPVTATLKTGDGTVIATDTVEVKDGQENAAFHLGTATNVGSYVITISSPTAGEIESQSFMVFN